MSDENKTSRRVELTSSVHVVIHMSDADIIAFRDWQRLEPSEKEVLIWVAEHGDPIKQGVKTIFWLGQTGYIITRLGIIAGAILSVIAIWNLFVGMP